MPWEDTESTEDTSTESTADTSTVEESEDEPQIQMPDGEIIPVSDHADYQAKLDSEQDEN